MRQLFYYKVRQVLLQSAIGITKCDNFITKCDRYYKVRRLLQSATEHTCSMERYIPVAQTRPKPKRVLLLWLRSTLIINYVLKEKSKYWARSIQPKFQPVRPGKEDHLKRWTRFFETFPVGPNRSIEFWTEISGKFG